MAMKRDVFIPTGVNLSELNLNDLIVQINDAQKDVKASGPFDRVLVNTIEFDRLSQDLNVIRQGTGLTVVPDWDEVSQGFTLLPID